MSLSKVIHSLSGCKVIHSRSGYTVAVHQHEVLHCCFRRSSCTQLLWQITTEANTEVSVSGAGTEHMSTPGIIIQKMKHAVSDPEENDLVLVFLCCLREVCVLLCV